MKKTILSHHDYLKNVNVTENVSLETDKVKAKKENQVASLTHKQYAQLIQNLERAICKFADNVVEIQIENLDLITFPLYFKNNLSMGYMQGRLDYGYYDEFYRYFDHHSKNFQKLISYTTYYETEYTSKVKQLNGTAKKLETLIQTTPNAEELRLEYKIALDKNKDTVNVVTKNRVVLAEDLPTIKAVDDKIKDLEFIYNKYTQLNKKIEIPMIEEYQKEIDSRISNQNYADKISQIDKKWDSLRETIDSSKGQPVSPKEVYYDLDEGGNPIKVEAISVEVATQVVEVVEVSEPVIKNEFSSYYKAEADRVMTEFAEMRNRMHYYNFDETAAGLIAEGNKVFKELEAALSDSKAVSEAELIRATDRLDVLRANLEDRKEQLGQELVNKLNDAISEFNIVKNKLYGFDNEDYYATYDEASTQGRVIAQQFDNLLSEGAVNYDNVLVSNDVNTKLSLLEGYTRTLQELAAIN